MNSVPRATVFVDADNTLWDTDKVFAQAQLDMLAFVEAATSASANARDRLAFVREIDQALAERHHAGLRYPPRLLARAVTLAIAGRSGDAAARMAWSGQMPSTLGDQGEQLAEQQFFKTIAVQPELRTGVVRGMTRLTDAGCLVLIVTEGAQARVEATARALGLDGYFTRVIEGKKRPELFSRVLRLTGSPEHAFMVGDQLDRDIGPAKRAGLTTIYFPGGFAPRWTPREAEVQPDHRIDDFDDGANIILRSNVGASPGRVSAGR
jgi:putative hydrolase of the HAD superfamily